MRTERTYSRAQIPTSKFYVKYSNFRIIPAKLCQATPVEFGSLHEAMCAGFVDIRLPRFVHVRIVLLQIRVKYGLSSLASSPLFPCPRSYSVSSNRS
jgi:hypothetical protein